MNSVESTNNRISTGAFVTFYKIRKMKNPESLGKK